MITLKVNDKDYTVDVKPDTPLLWVLRENLGLTGTKFGCGKAQCGACTVHIDGQPARSCVTKVSSVEGKDITTIEGLQEDLRRFLQQAWISEDAPQCGYCQTGQIMSAARKEGDAASAINAASVKLEAVYELPYLAHAPMETLNCVADVHSDGCDVWTGTQYQTLAHRAAMEITGLKPEQVRLHSTLLGGSFGRRGMLDSHFVREAVEISKWVKKPVKVIWSREDDIRGGQYRPLALHSLSAGLDEAGDLTAWRHGIVVQSFMMHTPFEMATAVEGLDLRAVEGAADLPYAVPHILVDWRQAPDNVPSRWWRAGGHSHTCFAVESLMDEVAHAMSKDPYQLRMSLLGNHHRHRAALELAAEKAGWEDPLEEGRGRGLAVHESFGSLVAQVAEVSVSETGKPRVHRVVCAMDCGP